MASTHHDKEILDSISSDGYLEKQSYVFSQDLKLSSERQHLLNNLKREKNALVFEIVYCNISLFIEFF